MEAEFGYVPKQRALTACPELVYLAIKELTVPSYDLILFNSIIAQ